MVPDVCQQEMFVAAKMSSPVRFVERLESAGVAFVTIFIEHLPEFRSRLHHLSLQTFSLKLLTQGNHPISAARVFAVREAVLSEKRLFLFVDRRSQLRNGHCIVVALFAA